MEWMNRFDDLEKISALKKQRMIGLLLAILFAALFFLGFLFCFFFQTRATMIAWVIGTTAFSVVCITFFLYSFFMLYQPVNVYLKLLTNPKKKENFEAGIFLKISEYTETHQGVVCRILWVEKNEKTLQIPVQKDEKIELKPGSSYRFLLKNDIVIGWEEEQ